MTTVPVRSVVMEAGEDRNGSRPSREALENLTETVPALVYIAEMGEHGEWHYISRQITEVLGYEPEEWRSDNTLWYRSIHPDDVERVMVDDRRRPTETEIVPPVEYRLRARDGNWVWVYECARLVVDSDGGLPLWHGVISDITALKAAEYSAERRAQQQALTARLGLNLIRSNDEQELIGMAVDALLGLGDIVAAEIWEYTDAGEIRLRHRSNYDGPELTLPLEADRYPGTELSEGKTVVIADWETDERMAPYIEHRAPNVVSTMVVPIDGTRAPFGFLSVHASVPDRFSPRDRDFLVAATSLIGSTIDRNRVERSLRHRLLHDSLTELPNRDLFSARLDQAMEKSRSAGQMMAALFLDIDRSEADQRRNRPPRRRSDPHRGRQPAACRTAGRGHGRPVRRRRIRHRAHFSRGR